MIAPLLKNGLDLKLVGKVVSKPYLDMTLALMSSFGVEVLKSENSYKIAPQNYSLNETIVIESDWSAASYWYQVAAFSDSCQIELKGLKNESLQGDSELVNLFKMFGVITTWTEQGVIISKSTVRFDYEKIYCFDLEQTPDLAQTLICTCAGLGLKAKFFGLSTLKIKETDRLVALKSELKKFSVQLVIVGSDEAELLNKSNISKPNHSVATYEDHRMAMSFAPLALVVGEVTIENSTVVKKSYPNYWNDMATVFNVVI